MKDDPADTAPHQGRANSAPVAASGGDRLLRADPRRISDTARYYPVSEMAPGARRGRQDHGQSRAHAGGASGAQLPRNRSPALGSGLSVRGAVARRPAFARASRGG